MKKFEVGKTYANGSICDHECIFKRTIESRTDKTITVRGKRFKVFVHEGIEFFYPCGKYSLCVVIKADSELK
jgi:hypothetical protein